MGCQAQLVKLNGRPHSSLSLHRMPTNRFSCVTCGTALSQTTDAPTGGSQCRSCAFTFSVPNFTSMSVFPPEVLALEVKFLCTSCQSRLGADARWEGRGVICPVCGDKTRVPLWSSILPRPPAPDVPGSGKAMAFSDTTLSTDEIAFLSEPAPASPRPGI